MEETLYEKNGYIGNYEEVMTSINKNDEDLEPFKFTGTRMRLFAKNDMDIPAIFESIGVDPLYFGILEVVASKALKAVEGDLVLYVAGSTPAVVAATVAVINVCHQMGKNIMLAYYDKDSGLYRIQIVD